MKFIKVSVVRNPNVDLPLTSINEELVRLIETSDLDRDNESGLCEPSDLNMREKEVP